MPVAAWAGFRDLGGNVWEWCEETAQEAAGDRVRRGASFDNGSKGYLWSSARGRDPADTRGDAIGFRVVLAGE